MFREESAFRVSRASRGTHTPVGNLHLSPLALRPSARSDPVVLCKHPSGTHTFGFPTHGSSHTSSFLPWGAYNSYSCDLDPCSPLIVTCEVKVAQSRPTLCDPMDYIVHGILLPEYWSG